MIEIVYTILTLVKQSVTVVVILFLTLVIYLYFCQNQMIYPTIVNGIQYPSENPFGYKNPNEQNLNYKELFIKTKDNIKLYGWIIYDKYIKKRTLIYFQENAGNIGFRLPFIKYLVSKLDFNCVIVGYRGYGLSEGSPSEEGLKLDGEAVVKYVMQNNQDFMNDLVDRQNVYIFGRSLGGAVAAHVAANLNFSLKGVIIENTFCSMGEMVDYFYPFIKPLKGLLLKNRWDTKSIIGKINYNMMFFISEYDEMVGTEQMKELIKLATKAKLKESYIIKNGNHIDGYLHDIDGYTKAFKKFLEKCENKNIDDSKTNETIDYINETNELKKNK